jgi:hypothetical protein
MPLGLLAADSNIAGARSSNCVVRNEGFPLEAPQWRAALGPKGAAASFSAPILCDFCNQPEVSEISTGPRLRRSRDYRPLYSSATVASLLLSLACSLVTIVDSRIPYNLVYKSPPCEGSLQNLYDAQTIYHTA